MSNEPNFATTLEDIDIEKLKAAEWNYKKPSTPLMLEKLKQSILRDKSAGVLCVRVLKNGSYEVIDGNHRLEALKEMGFKKVRCENFGEISDAAAATVATRRNHQWFEDDTIRLAKLVKETVIPEVDLSTLSEFMPQSQKELSELVKLCDFDWEGLPSGKVKAKGSEGEPLRKLSVEVDLATERLWNEWVVAMKKKHEIDTKEAAFSILLRVGHKALATEGVVQQAIDSVFEVDTVPDEEDDNDAGDKPRSTQAIEDEKTDDENEKQEV